MPLDAHSVCDAPCLSPARAALADCIAGLGQIAAEAEKAQRADTAGHAALLAAQADVGLWSGLDALIAQDATDQARAALAAGRPIPRHFPIPEQLRNAAAEHDASLTRLRAIMGAEAELSRELSEARARESHAADLVAAAVKAVAAEDEAKLLEHLFEVEAEAARIRAHLIGLGKQFGTATAFQAHPAISRQARDALNAPPANAADASTLLAPVTPRPIAIPKPVMSGSVPLSGPDTQARFAHHQAESQAARQALGAPWRAYAADLLRDATTCPPWVADLDGERA